MIKILVAINQRHNKNQYGDFVDSLENSYITYFEKLGINLIVIPNCSENVSFYFDKFPIKGIILTGGDTIDPRIYGGEKNDDYNFSSDREKTERKLIEIAIAKKLPVLGICRGMQFINVFFDGKLIYVKESVKNLLDHVAKTHKIELLDKLNLGHEVEVNSYHNQGVIEQVLGKGLNVFAKSPDGIIEGIFHESLPILGIEWHPERKSPNEEFNKKIIEAFKNKELFWKND